PRGRGAVSPPLLGAVPVGAGAVVPAFVGTGLVNPGLAAPGAVGPGPVGTGLVGLVLAGVAAGLAMALLPRPRTLPREQRRAGGGRADGARPDRCSGERGARVGLQVAEVPTGEGSGADWMTRYRLPLSLLAGVAAL